MVKFVKVGFLLLRSDPFINFLSLDCLVLVWFGLVWVSLVGKIWLGWLNRFGLVKFVKVGFLLLRSDPLLIFLVWIAWFWFGFVWFG